MSEEYGAQEARLLKSHFFPSGVDTEPIWHEIPSAHADWRVAPLVDENNEMFLMAVRTSNGVIKSFHVPICTSDALGHLEIDRNISSRDASANVGAQIEMGIYVPGSEEMATLDELVEVVRLISEIDETKDDFEIWESEN